MKLKEIITKYNPMSKVDDPIEGDNLDLIKNALIEGEEFSECNVKFLTKEVSDNTFPLIVSTIKLTDNTKFYGDVKVCRIQLTVPLYFAPNISDFYAKDCVIAPTMYNPVDFAPYKFISLRWSPELVKDKRYLTNDELGEEFRIEMHALLEKVLNNMDDYEMPSHRGVLLTGVWDKVVT